MGKYIRKNALCDSCGESAHQTSPYPDLVPVNWGDGTVIHPLNNSRGITCPVCRWTDFDDFCSSQGVSPYNPVRAID